MTGLDAELYDAYQARLRDLGALDFDDLLTEGLKRDVTGLRCFRHLLVDEFQDINDIQYQPGPGLEPERGRACSSSATRTSPSTASGAPTGRVLPAAARGASWCYRKFA